MKTPQDPEAAETVQNTQTPAVVQKRLVRWELRAEPGELFKWELCRTDGSSAATVWENGIWHTWDQNGGGGENSSQDCVSNAQIAAMLSAINQGFISANAKAHAPAVYDSDPT